MDEETMIADAVSDEVGAAIDADWDDAPAPEEAEPKADQPGDGETDDTPAEETKPEEEDKADQPEFFELKHLDEVKRVNRDEVVTLAQKGLDYDRIRTDRDGLKAAAEKNAAAVQLVESYAKKQGMSVEAYLDFCREQELVAEGMTEQTAKAQLAVEKQQAQVQAEAERLAAERQRQELAERAVKLQEEARQANFAQFLAAYPDVKPDSIPQEVWAMVKEGTPLLTAYTKHENNRLKVELEAERKNRENAAKTTGSQSTSGEHTGDPWNEGWDD